MGKLWGDNVNLKIYMNHTLSSWGNRMWGFAVGLYLVILYPESLQLAAALGFSVCLSVIILGSYLGKWIDHSQRLKVANLALFCQVFFVILGCVLLSLNIYFQTELQLIWSGHLQELIYIVIIVIAVMANLASIASDIAIERDWVVILSNGDEKKLAAMNATMRTIDLTTNILAPLVLGQIITFGSQLWGTIFIAIWNFVSAFLEFYLLTVIYKAVPQLGHKTATTTSSTKNSSSNTWDNIKESLAGWKLYFNHPIRFAGVAFAMLFMTVMGFDSVTLGYIYSQGGSESLIGIITGVGAIFGILGSVAFPYMRESLGKYFTANIGFGLNLLILMFCVGSVFGPGSPFQPESIFQPFTSSNDLTVVQENKTIIQLWNENQNVFFFIIGIVLARFGLWTADLSVTQMFQEGVSESNRGVINGVQNSLNQFVNLFKFFLVILYPSVQAFGYLIFLSAFFMLVAWIFFIIFSLTDKSLSSHPDGDKQSATNSSERSYLLQSDSDLTESTKCSNYSTIQN